MTCAFCVATVVDIPSVPPLSWTRDSEQGDASATQVRAACQACLDGWMRDLDGRAAPTLRPLIEGDRTPRFLGVEERAAVAAWTLKTAMLLEFLRPEASRYFTRDERTALMQTGLPPVNHTAVWLASCRAGTPVSASDRVLLLSFEKGASVDDTHGYASTFAIGQVALQILTVRAQERPVVLDAVVTRPWLDSTLAVWPAAGGRGGRMREQGLAWPPLLALDDAGLAALRSRWDGLSDELTHAVRPSGPAS